MARLVLDRLGKTYAGGVEAVRGVSLDVPDGAFCVLVGPSGCGKSTVLRMIAGLETVTAGAISIGERVVNDVEPAERDIAMVFQNYALYPHMRVYDNLAYGLRNRGTPKAEIETRVREAARMLGLGDLLTRYPRQLSGGQRQRVAMGRAIVRKPQVFLFDEPLSNLDAKLRVQMRVEIRRLQRQLGVTTVYVTHDQVEAMTMADRLVVMNAGRIEQVGTPLEIYRRPETRYVATFMGAPPMNILPGEAAAEGVRLAGALFPARHGLPPGRPVEIGLRPEALRLAADGLPFRAAFAEELGATRLLHGELAGAPLVVQVPAGPEPAEGASVSLALDPADLHLFDPDSGRRIGGG
ncbi:ABC transporter ATP-binding protein [Methylobacterium isbiliense]|jgi:sn-glycerol 3-phosphate transport system ATP-binding protein|uniref:Sn-glycerol-3-phosphate import ATP-binding protein UgpC n=1 Tax=Methylobacterium isbiliense TaxID=315478 RepID=A0ABQ4SBA4_9HYPH|nr:sn-glycerol-3-phosphate ABC transporter ATP-binding protein UgpC [Methylobacterium isbiliense]MDN3623597.1 sn-glycerol-3-phosphate ABC transporter ATP-binding protein UgpC [Methylobacterium isbiliense]GJD99739.1 sn-glycerol-3-phosphate import ATP-binding protein UgpC [Methylobacterium isbiliense]